jgi:hypothetical protein
MGGVVHDVEVIESHARGGRGAASDARAPARRARRASAAQLAQRSGLPRQRVNYHVAARVAAPARRRRPAPYPSHPN